VTPFLDIEADEWQSDYTHNGNVPSTIASMLMANMPECMEAYLIQLELLPGIRQKIAVTIAGDIQSIVVEGGDATIHEETTWDGGRIVTLPAGKPVALKIIRRL
jgi:hypothetical protein